MTVGIAVPERLGATLANDGVEFAVWAPNADKVYVLGDFNDWSESANSLSQAEGGHWVGRVEGAQAGDEYLFLVVNGDQKLRRIDPYARAVTSSVGNAIIVDPAFDWEDDDFHLPAWNEIVIYEMHVGTLNRKDDGTPGSLEEVIAKLDYLRNLGVNAIQLMPPVEFAGDLSWGYNPAHIFAIESAYGTPDGFKEFVKAAHSQGIGVIIDVVYNHFGPSDLDLWRFDGWGEGEYGGIYFYNDDRAETPWAATRPDYGREEVRRYILDNVRMWLDEYRVDGLRFDSTVNMRNKDGVDGGVGDIPEGWTLLQAINDLISSTRPNALSIAEDMQGNRWITKSTGEGGAGFGAQWGADFVHRIREALLATSDDGRNLDAVVDALSATEHEDSFKRVIYVESHDEVANGQARIAEEIDPGNASSYYARKRVALGAGLLFTAPGIPMLFQGQEFLEDEWFRDDDPLDWRRAEEFSHFTQLFRDLAYLRRNIGGESRGLTDQKIEVRHVNHGDKVLAYFRHGDDGPPIVVIANFSDQAHENYRVGLPVGGRWKVLFNSDASLYSDDFENIGPTLVESDEIAHDGLRDSGTIEVGPYSVLILAKE